MDHEFHSISNEFLQYGKIIDHLEAWPYRNQIAQ